MFVCRNVCVCDCVIVLLCVYVCARAHHPLMATLASTAKSVLLDTLGLVLLNWLELKGTQVVRGAAEVPPAASRCGCSGRSCGFSYLTICRSNLTDVSSSDSWCTLKRSSASTWPIRGQAARRDSNQSRGAKANQEVGEGGRRAANQETRGAGQPRKWSIDFWIHFHLCLLRLCPHSLVM